MNVVWVPPLAAMAFAAGAMTAAPSAAGQVVEVRIGAVLASNSGQECDPALVAMHRQFQTLFPYSSYRLVKEERQLVSAGTKAAFDIPGGRYLLVGLDGMKNNRVSLHVMLIEGSRLLVDTALTLRNNATFLVAGPRQQGGVLLISIGAESAPTPAEAVPTSTE